MENGARAEFVKIVLGEVLPAIAKAYCAVGLEQEKFANLKGRKELAENLVKKRTGYLNSTISKYIEKQEEFLLESFNETLKRCRS